MWTINKLDKKKIKLFENELEKKIGNNFMIYNPKIMIQKYYKNRLLDKHINLLGDYIMCHHPKFKELNKAESIYELILLKYQKVSFDENQPIKMVFGPIKISITFLSLFCILFMPATFIIPPSNTAICL